MTSFFTTPSGQIIPCLVTDVKMLRLFWFIASRCYWSLTSPLKFQEFNLNTLQGRNVGVKSVGTKVDVWGKCTLSFLQEGFEHLTSHNWGGGSDWNSGEGLQWLFLFVKSYRSSHKGKWQFEAKPFSTYYTSGVVHVFKAFFLQSFFYIC